MAGGCEPWDTQEMKGTSQALHSKGRKQGDRVPGPGEAGCESQGRGQGQASKRSGVRGETPRLGGAKGAGLRGPGPRVGQTRMGSSPTESCVMGQVGLPASKPSRTHGCMWYPPHRALGRARGITHCESPPVPLLQPGSAHTSMALPGCDARDRGGHPPRNSGLLPFSALCISPPRLLGADYKKSRKGLGKGLSIWGCQL